MSVFISVKVESTFNAFLSSVIDHYLMSIFFMIPGNSLHS